MITKINMPKLGLTMQSGEVLKWFKKEGDKVEKDEPIVEIETEKVVFVVEAVVSGILRKIIASEGEVIMVGGLLGIIADPGEEISHVIEEESRPKEVGLSVMASDGNANEIAINVSQKVHATPRAKKMAREKGIDLTLIKGTGPMNQIVEKDVETFSQKGTDRRRIKEIRPYIGVRKTIGQRMTESLRTSPQYTMTTDTNMEELISFYNEFGPQMYKENGINVTYTEILAKLVCEVLKKHPLLNSSLVGDQILVYNNINLGIAVASDHGLVVPVINDAENKSLLEISEATKALVEKVRTKRLGLDDVTGGTFTISNMGIADIDIFTPIINPPETAIIGIGKMKERPLVIDGNIVMKPTVQLSLTVDHRIIDGMDGANFIQDLKRAIEDPYQTLGYWKFGQARAVCKEGLVVNCQMRKFKLVIDEPFELGGSNKGPNPVEAFMGAFLSCFVLMLKVAAKARNMIIERIDGLIQPDSFEKINRISFDLTFFTNESTQTINKLLKIAEKLCPIHNVIGREIQIDFNINVIQKNSQEQLFSK